MTMYATVLSVQPGALLVRDHTTRQNVLVHTRRARSFSPGEPVVILYSGAMTMSIPPQITAMRILRVPVCC